MERRKELLGYCGTYCGDCPGYTGVIADASENLKEVLDRHKFARTARCIFPEELREYDRFYEMLQFMTGLRCPGKCRKAEATETSCEVRSCCRAKRYHACYKCGDFEVCDTLKSLFGGLHYEVNIRNLRAIKETGLENWLERHT